MIKKVLIIYLLLIVLTILKLDNYNNYSIDKTFTINNIKIPQIMNIAKGNKNNIIGKLIIKKIHLKNDLYDINDKRNNIEENVTILKESTMPDQENSIIFIAAHSGVGNKAFFKKLDKLEKNDQINLIYKDKEYNYIVKDIIEIKKNGFINVRKEKENQLILTTCSPNKEKYQLVINCIEKRVS